MLLVSVSDTCGAVLYSADKDKRILSASYDFLNCSAALLKPNSALQYSVIALIINPSVSFITFTPSFFISALQAAIQSFISSVIFSLVLLIRSAARIFSVNVVVDILDESELTEEDKRAAEEAAAEAAAKAEEEEAATELVKVKAQRRFLDKELNQIKDTGDEYAVSRERAAVLEEAGVAAVIEE